MYHCLLPVRLAHHKYPALLLIAVSLLALAALAEPAQVSVEMFYSVPDPAESVLSGFDLDTDGTLHFSVGDPNWGLKCEVYRRTPEGQTTGVFKSGDVLAGSVKTIGSRVYFSDGGNYSGRSDYDFFMYDAATPAAPVNDFLITPYGASLGMLTERYAAELFATGSEVTWGPAALFYGTLNRSGYLEEGTLRNIGDIGESPGPMVIDARNTLYYAHGYVFSGSARIFRWNASEVDAALADAETHPLRPDTAHWATLPPDYGATGMAVDDAGNLFLTATAWEAPSHLLAYRADDATQISVYDYPGRLGTVRYHEGALYVSTAADILRIPLLQTLREAPVEDTGVQTVPGETVVLALNPNCGVGEKTYQWFRINGDKSVTPVGDGASHYSFTASLEDSGTVFYCLVSDALTEVEAAPFTVTVQHPVPIASGTTLAICILLLFTTATLTLRRHVRRTHA